VFLIKKNFKRSSQISNLALKQTILFYLNIIYIYLSINKIGCYIFLKVEDEVGSLSYYVFIIKTKKEEAP
jgi:hypothetical protein